MLKAHIILFIIPILAMRCKAQENLIPNPSFEYYISCPQSTGDLRFATPWFQACKRGWGSSDLYVYGCPWYPYFQKPRTGNAYAGIVVFNTPFGHYRELIEVMLSDSLFNGKKYYFELYTSLINKANYAISDICACFTKDSLNIDSLMPHPCPGILFKNPDGSYITDTVNWVKISGVFTANGGGKFVTIGNLFKTEQTHYIQLDTIVTWDSYYFFDDVALYEINDTLMQAEAGKSTSICRGQSVALGKHNYPAFKYRWHPATGLSDTANGQPTASPLHTTTYYLTQTAFNDSISKDSVTVTVNNCDSTLLNKVSFYPNPASDYLYLEFSQFVPPNTTAYITNAIGQVLIKEAIPTNEKKKLLNISALAGGIYFCRIYSGSEMVKCEKIVKTP